MSTPSLFESPAASIWEALPTWAKKLLPFENVEAAYDKYAPRLDVDPCATGFNCSFRKSIEEVFELCVRLRHDPVQFWIQNHIGRTAWGERSW